MADENVQGGEGQEEVTLPSSQPNAPEGMPEGGVEKFWDAEKKEYNWQAHAKDAEYRFNQSKKDREAAAAATEKTSKSDADGQSEKKDDDQGTQGGAVLDLAAAQKEYDEAGELSKETREKFNKAGLTDDYIDTYLAGLEAIAEKTTSAIYAATEGEENYKQMISWAAQNLPKEDVEAFNKLANDHSNISSFKLAVEALYGRFLEANGARPRKRIVGGGSGSNAGDTYESWAQVTKDMRDPRYRNDPAYRDAVERKLDRSPLGGVRVVGEDVYRG